MNINQVSSEDLVYYYNAEMVEKYNVTVPEGYLAYGEAAE